MNIDNSTLVSFPHNMQVEYNYIDKAYTYIDKDASTFENII